MNMVIKHLLGKDFIRLRTRLDIRLDDGNDYND
jgi:hypothetical protein